MRGVKLKGKGIEIDLPLSTGRFRKTLKLPQTSTGLKQAEQLRAAILYQDDTGILDLAKHFPKCLRARRHSPNVAAHTTIKEGINLWMEYKKVQGSSETTLRTDWSRIELYILPAFGKLKITEMTIQPFREWVTKLPINMNKTKNNISSIVTAYYKHIYADGVIEIDPLARYKNLPTHHTQKEPYDPEEIKAFLLAVENDQMRNYFGFAFETGIRPPTEMLGLRWTNVDWDNSRVFISEGLRNGKKVNLKTVSSKRHVRLNYKAMSYLESQKLFNKNHERIFVDPTTMEVWKNNESIRKRFWNPARIKAGLRKQSPYVTRHSYASINLSKGQNFKYIADQMGHSDLTMLFKHYGKFLPSVSSFIDQSS